MAILFYMPPILFIYFKFFKIVFMIKTERLLSDGGKNMGMSIWSLIAYIAAIIFWNSKLKRNIGEAMVVGWLVVLLFGGSKFLSL